MSTGAMQLSVRASLDALPFLLDRVDSELGILGLNKEGRTSIMLAIDEVFSNIIMHGQLNSSNDRILLRLSHAKGQICVDICDNGPPFDPILPASGSTIVSSEETFDDLQIGGWGLLLVKTLASDIQHARDDDMNRFTMRFPFPEVSDDAKSSA